MIIRKKYSLRIILGALLGAVVGFVLTYGISLLDVLPFLNGETSYETVMTYLFASSITGAIVGGVWAVRKT